MPKQIKSWFSIEAKDDSTEADVIIYDEIGIWGITAKDFINEVKDLDVDTINLRLNTPGGSVFDGTAIFNILKDHSARVVAHVDGLAASIGSFIAMAADEVRMAKNAYMMIHNTWGLAVGDSDAMEKMASLLTKMNDTIAATYADKAGAAVEHIKELMSAETWFTGEEALAEGLVDTVTGAVEVNASFDLSKFEHVPQAITESFTGGQPSIRDLETALRDAGGLSQVDAKTLLAKGYSALEHRDDATPPHRDDEPKNTNTSKEAEVKNIDELKAQHPDLYEQVHALGVASVDVDAAVAKAHEDEVARIVAVKAQGQKMPGFDKEIEAMVSDGKTTGPEAAVALIDLQDKQRADAAAKLGKDAKGINVPEAPTGALGAGGAEDEKDFMTLVRDCMKEENISKASAISMTVKAHPKAHKAYLDEANKKEDDE